MKIADSINNYKLIHAFDGESGDTLHFLDFIYEGLTDTESPQKRYDGLGSDEETPLMNMGLKMFAKKFVLEDHYIDIRPDDPSFNRVLEDHVVMDVVYKMMNIAKPLDDVTFTDGKMGVRSLMAKILAAANHIASAHRRGPANFIVVGQETYDVLRDAVGYQAFDGYVKRPVAFDQLAGMNVMICDGFGNEILVGRQGSSLDEPSVVRALIPEPTIGDYITEPGELEPSGVSFRYVVDVIGHNPGACYAKFKANLVHTGLS